MRPAGDEETFEAFNRETQSLCAEAHGVASRQVSAWLAHIRVVADQPWLGTKTEPPRQHGRIALLDRDAGVTLMQLATPRSITIRLGELALSLADLDRVRHLVDVKESPPTTESMLADARFLVREAEVVDAQRPVLIAAMACEIKTKAVVAAKVDSSNAELLELVLRRVSNLPSLLDRPLIAALGISLRTADPQLFRRISGLARRRNEIVHGGAERSIRTKDGRSLPLRASCLRGSTPYPNRLVSAGVQEDAS